MPRVLMGDFAAMVGLGLREILDMDGTDVTTEHTPTCELLDRVADVMPDVVLVDLEAATGEAAARQIASLYPAVKVIACSSARPEMRIFPPFHHGESYVSRMSPALLVEAVCRKG